MDVYEWTNDRVETRWNEETQEWEQYVAATYFNCVLVEDPQVNYNGSSNFGGSVQGARDGFVGSWNNWHPEDPKVENDFTWKSPPEGWTNPNDPPSTEPTPAGGTSVQ